MELPLVTTLILFSAYAIACVLPLWNTFKSTKRTDLLVNGLYLIFLASFVLTGLALVTGVAENIVHGNKLTADQSDQLAGFMQYIIFGSFLVSLLFGAVGANIFSTGLLSSSNTAIFEKLTEIENKIEKVHKIVQVGEQHKVRNFTGIKAAASLGALVILYLLW